MNEKYDDKEQAEAARLQMYDDMTDIEAIRADAQTILQDLKFDCYCERGAKCENCETADLIRTLLTALDEANAERDELKRKNALNLEAAELHIADSERLRHLLREVRESFKDQMSRYILRKIAKALGE